MLDLVFTSALPSLLPSSATLVRFMFIEEYRMYIYYHDGNVYKNIGNDENVYESDRREHSEAY